MGVDINSPARTKNPLGYLELTQPIFSSSVATCLNFIKVLINAGYDLKQKHDFSQINTVRYFGTVPFPVDWSCVSAVDFYLMKGSVSNVLVLLCAGAPYSFDNIAISLPNLRKCLTPAGGEIELSARKEKLFETCVRYIEDFIGTPRSLLRLSTEAVNRRIPYATSAAVDSLGLPNPIREHLLAPAPDAVTEYIGPR